MASAEDKDRLSEYRKGKGDQNRDVSNKNIIKQESIVKIKSLEKYFENFNLSRSCGNIFKGLKKKWKGSGPLRNRNLDK